MNLVDSSGWLAFFSEGKNAAVFGIPIQNIDSLLVATIVMYEVFKLLLRESGEQNAIIAIAHMQLGNSLDFTPDLSIAASRISLDYKLPMTDSIILASAQSSNAIVWTQDEHFKGIKNVKYFPA
jgi:toxin FitB